MVYNLKPFTYFLIHCLLLEIGLQIKTMKYQCETVYNNNNNTLVFGNEFRTLAFFCLLNFEHDSTIFPPLLLAYTFDVLYLIRQHNKPNTIRYLLCAIYYALYTIYYALCTMHYALCIMHYALCTMHTYLYVFIRIYYFIRIHTYLLFHMEIRRNPVILVLTRSSRRVE